MTTDEISAVRDVQLAHDPWPKKGTGAPDAPVLVWGHGLTMNRALDDAGAMIDWSAMPGPVLRYDARGHGHSSATDDPAASGWDQLALDQLGLTAALGIDRYVAGGASMGCATALHAAVTAPERIMGLVLMIPPTAWETRAAQVSQYAAGAELVSTGGVEPLVVARRVVGAPDPHVGDADYLARREAALRSWDPQRLAAAMRGATTADLPDRGQIAGITVPTLILAWTGDPAHPRSTAEELAGLIENAELHLASDAAQLELWTSRIRCFLAGPNIGGGQ